LFSGDLHDSDPELFLVFIAKISNDMNVLILTPDAVGSTLLQRLVTIYMQFHQYDQPVINLHELTNGLTKYHNQHFDQEVLGRKSGKWGYFQSLQQIVELLDSVDHFKTARLAHYHIKNRQDPIEQQLQFYEYLNKNFYIISCRRHNLFEHALSWCLTKITKKLNVYDNEEKVNNFFGLYKDGIDLDPNSLIQTLNAYRDYIDWCNNHFAVANYFYYEEHVPQIEKYILNLPFFRQSSANVSWQDKFGISFDHWNLCHYLGSDLGTLALDQPVQFAQLSDHTKLITNSTKTKNKINDFLQAYQTVADPSWPSITSLEEYERLPIAIRDEVEKIHQINVSDYVYDVVEAKLPVNLQELLPATHQNFLDLYQPTYKNSLTSINGMVRSGIIPGTPPIKKQTLAEKKHIVKNFQHLLTVYNQWIEKNPNMGNALDADTLDHFAMQERKQWSPVNSTAVISAEQKKQQS
jgi:hypothetical protein